MSELSWFNYTIRTLANYMFFIFIFTFVPILLKAQLCSGNLGDPIINIDFGDGYNPGLPSTRSDYKFVNGCPANGEYTISGFLFGCSSNTWFALTGDHSHTTLNGNYMLVNGAGLQGTVIVDTARGLCGNTTYQFAGWVTNVMGYKTCNNNPALTNLTFSVETVNGVVLATYTTGNISLSDTRIWNEYGVFFTTSADVNTVVLRIKSNTKTDCGSAFSIDDITLKACGPSINAKLDNFENGVADVCAGYTNPFVITATYSPGFIDPVTQWQNSFDTGKTWKDLAGETATTYAIPRRNNSVVLYRMVAGERANFNAAHCRVASNIIWTNVHPAPPHQPTADLIGCLNKDFTFPANNAYILNYNWQGPNGFSSIVPTPLLPKLQSSDTGIYSVLMTFEYGCQIKDSFNLQAFPSTTITANKEYTVCDVSSVQLSAFGDGSFQWTPATTLSNDTIANPIANPTAYTQYKVVLTNIFGCKDSAFVNVHVNESIRINTGGDKQLLLGDTATIHAEVTGTGAEYYWSPPLYINDIYSLKPKVYPTGYFEYTLHANSTVGCGNKTAVVKIKVLNDFYIPNAFTPNADGKNDFFRVPALDNYIADKFLIYNRWGTVIFQTTDLKRGWDGNVNGYPQPTGTYIYYLFLHSNSGKIISRKGTILLMR